MLSVDAKPFEDAAVGNAGPDAFYELGLRCATGDGAPADLIHAHKWFNLAAAGGDPCARDERSMIAEFMTPDQIARAQRLAREWVLDHHRFRRNRFAIPLNR